MSAIPQARQTQAFLSTAAEIGQRLAQEAVWYQDCCNWLGVIPNERNRTSPMGMTYRALGPDVYDGTSGVAWFLAELYAATGEAAFRRTALGAIQQALSRVDWLPSQGRLGLFTGLTGIALAAARVGTILGEPVLRKQAGELLQGCVWENHGEREFDLISGSAGAITALLVLQDILEDGSWLDAAVQLGDKLLRAAEVSDQGCSWKGDDRFEARNLTGLSHGTAGAAYALLELFRATGDENYRSTAENAFDYERSWFNDEAANWPDFRKDRTERKTRARPLTFASFWCHGAPGIALTRLRAYEILNDETFKAEADTALRTTQRSIVMWLHSGRGNYSLCHGLAGNADVLLYGYQALGQEWSEGAALAQQVGYEGITRYAANGHMWPCGTHGGDTPGLMLGLAGIGYFYLRLYDPTVPSILILQRERRSVSG